MNILAALRERIRLVIGTAIGAFLLLTCGVLMILVLSPQQAKMARRIERCPIWTRHSPAAAVALTGQLVGAIMASLSQVLICYPSP